MVRLTKTPKKQRRIDEERPQIRTDGEAELATQISAGLQRKAQVRKGLCDGADPEAVNSAAFVTGP